MRLSGIAGLPASIAVIALWVSCAGSDPEHLRIAVAEDPENARAQFELALALADGDHKDEALAYFEQAIALDPDDLRYGNRYRRICVNSATQQRAIDFLEAQVKQHPNSVTLHLNLALAYVDKMPTAGLGIVGQGLLSNRSIGELNRVLELTPDSWVAMYGRALNHLHWPSALRHAPRAIEGFKSCLRLQESISPEALEPHHLLPYLGLGDAFVKNDEIDEARKIWQAAAALFPGDSRLVHRQRLTNETLRAFVRDERGLEKPIDTDLTFLLPG